MTMVKYNIWISCGENSSCRTYFNELGAVQLTQEQVEKYFTFDDVIQFDSDLLAEKTDVWGEEIDFPTWDTITDGCIGWGPDTDDQNIGVCLADDEEETQIWMSPINQLTWYSKEEIEGGVPQEDKVDTAVGRIFYEMNEPEGVWILYNSYERGSYIGEFELPDDVEFDPKKLVVNVTEVADSWTIVTGIEYDGEDIYCDGDTIGKGIDWYVYYRGQLESFK